jgi:hypothetical protein
MIKYITSDTKQATYLRDHLKFYFGGLLQLDRRQWLGHGCGKL